MNVKGVAMPALEIKKTHICLVLYERQQQPVSLKEASNYIVGQNNVARIQLFVDKCRFGAIEIHKRIVAEESCKEKQCVVGDIRTNEESVGFVESKIVVVS